MLYYKLTGDIHMSERTETEIIKQIHELLETRVAPAVASHGGEVNFVSYANGTLKLQMSGACAGCAGSTMTLKHGIEGMMMHYIPEITAIEAEDDVVTNPFYADDVDMIPIQEIHDDLDN